MSRIDATIQATVELFVDQLTQLIREATMELVKGAITGSVRPTLMRPKATASKSASTPKAKRPKKGAKRSPDALGAITTRLLGYVANHPGLRIEQIGKALGVSTKDLALPVRKLVATKKITTRGQKRATSYYPAKGGAPNGRAAKVSRKPNEPPRRSRVATPTKAKTTAARKSAGTAASKATAPRAGKKSLALGTTVETPAAGE